jgi:hypothetical protein
LTKFEERLLPEQIKKLKNIGPEIN